MYLNWEFYKSHKKRIKLMGSAMKITIISIINKEIAPSLCTRSEAKITMVEDT